MSKKMIEIPEDTAREWAEFVGRLKPARWECSMHEAVKKALPPSRDERLGLPWSVDACCVEHEPVDGESAISASTEEQARLIAKAPEMAALLKRLTQDEDFSERFFLTRAKTIRILREAGWIDEQSANERSRQVRPMGA